MLFNESCKTGRLQFDGTTVWVISPFHKIVWSVPREAVTYIGLKTGPMMADLTIYTATNHFPAPFMARQKAEQFLTFFPGVPTGTPPPVAQPQTYVPPMAQGSQWYAEPTAAYQVPPPLAKKKTPRWAYIATGVIALVLCACISTAVIAAVTSNNNSQKQGTLSPTSTTASTSQSSTLATTVTADTPTTVPTHAPTPTAKPTAKPTPKPVATQPPAPPPTPTPKPSCNGINGNPWCYDFNPGNLIYTPPSGFCNYFNCIPSFYGSDDPGDGYINECSDGTYSQSGGERGDCSSHGGELRPLYAH